jgi:hypothetical protein
MEAKMAKFRVTLKRVIYVEVVIEATSLAEARIQAAESPDDLFSLTNCVGTDTTTVSKVEREADQ